jgi:hypothetical protein
MRTMLPTTPKLLFALAVAGAGIAATVPAAQAAYPGANGKIVFVEHGKETEFTRLVVAQPDGSGRTPLGEFDRDVDNPVWSPDGTRIAFQERAHGDADWNINVYDTRTGETTPAVELDHDQTSPTWSPDGTWIAYAQQGDIDKVRADGSSAQPTTVLDEESALKHPAWSSTNLIAFVVPNAENDDIYAVPADDPSATATPVVTGASDDHEPDWSPDGKQVVFNHEGQVQITTLGGDRGPVEYDGDGDSGPVFAPAGGRLLWSSPRTVMDQPGMRLFTSSARIEADDVAPIDPVFLNGASAPDWQPVGGTPHKPAREEPKADPPAPPVQLGGPAPVQVPQLPKITLPRAAKAASRTCASKRVFRIRLKRSRGDVIARAKVVVNGKQVKVKKLDRLYATVDLRKLPRGAFDVHITTTMTSGRTTKDVRRYKTCTPRGGSRRP